MIIAATIVLGFLVFIHEGGHFLAARLFGVRVTEFMIGFPGPSIGFTKGDTRFGVMCIAKVKYIAKMLRMIFSYLMMKRMSY